ncbi:sulfur oxidation c-type cytochrome SoxA [Microvirga sp. GCM10011540]|uniref:sulfur oxidation c-type cytochrome SoxA n=1 Tax=Microvirga sp. GCM10011540 TaxID=3317338 RepID=UPI0036074619
MSGLLQGIAWSAGALSLGAVLASAQPSPPAERLSGFDFMSPESQTMQRDDIANPGMLWVAEGDALWSSKANPSGRSCGDCHGDAAVSMKGVAARYPAYSAEQGRPIDLQGRINLCRTANQNATPLPFESRELLALTAFVGKQSRGMLIVVGDDERLEPFRVRGQELYERRQGQLNFSCANCHDDNWGQKLASSVIPQAHPTGYPIYRLEWQDMGSLQRRLRNCMVGVRAEPYAYGSPEYVDLELFLMTRARGMPLETPAVRP